MEGHGGHLQALCWFIYVLFRVTWDQTLRIQKPGSVCKGRNPNFVYQWSANEIGTMDAWKTFKGVVFCDPAKQTVLRCSTDLGSSTQYIFQTKGVWCKSLQPDSNPKNLDRAFGTTAAGRGASLLGEYQQEITSSHRSHRKTTICMYMYMIYVIKCTSLLIYSIYIFIDYTWASACVSSINLEPLESNTSRPWEPEHTARPQSYAVAASTRKEGRLNIPYHFE